MFNNVLKYGSIKLGDNMKKVIIAIISLLIILGVPYYIVLENHEFYLQTEKLSVEEGKETKIDIIPKNEKNYDVNDYIFEVEDENIAEIDKEGNIVAKKEGKTKVKVKYKYGITKKEVEIQVVKKDNYIEAKKIVLNKSNATIKKGESITLKATIEPKDATNQKITWTSNDKTIATVDASGKVKGVKKGLAIISAKVDNKEATCKVIVEDPTSVKEKIELFEVTLPGTLKMGSPRMSLQMVPQLVEDGVGVYWYPHTSLPSVSRPYEILGDGCLANLVNPSATVLLWKR